MDAVVTTPRMGEVESRLEQRSRTMQERLPNDSVTRHNSSEMLGYAIANHTVLSKARKTTYKFFASSSYCFRLNITKRPEGLTHENDR